MFLTENFPWSPLRPRSTHTTSSKMLQDVGFFLTRVGNRSGGQLNREFQSLEILKTGLWWVLSSSWPCRFLNQWEEAQLEKGTKHFD
jgi:hypothetical protein